jgi:hypothetical protein
MAQADVKLTKGLQGMGRGLVAEFIIGVVLATYAAYDSELGAGGQSKLHYIVFGLHVLIAVTLLIGSGYILTLALKTKQVADKQNGWIGFLSVLIALVGGVVIVAKPDLESLGIVVMSLGFIVALVVYGRWYFQVKK